MKTITKVIPVCFLLLSFTVSAFSQATARATEKKAAKKHKIEKSKVPTVVTENFIREYSMSPEESWYGYPAFTAPYDWYSFDPYLYTEEYPENYIVEFNRGNVPHKVIYSKAGKKIATHRKLNTALPAAVSSAINKSEYKTWMLTEEQEEIFKDGDADNLKVYKVEVEKGMEKHFLFYQTDGKLLKDKKA